MPRRRLPTRVLGPYEDRRNGIWYLISIERDAEGKSKRVRTTAASEDEANDLKADLEAEIEAPQEMTVQLGIEGYLSEREACRHQADQRGGLPAGAALDPSC